MKRIVATTPTPSAARRNVKHTRFAFGGMCKGETCGVDGVAAQHWCGFRSWGVSRTFEGRVGNRAGSSPASDTVL